MATEKKLTYEQAMQRIDAIVAKIESGEMDIDSLAANIKEAKQLVAFCKDKLTRVESEVQEALPPAPPHNGRGVE